MNGLFVEEAYFYNTGIYINGNRFPLIADLY